MGTHAGGHSESAVALRKDAVKGRASNVAVDDNARRPCTRANNNAGLPPVTVVPAAVVRVRSVPETFRA